MSPSKSKDKSVAIIGFNDGLAGQTFEWFEQTTDFYISLFIDESESLEDFCNPELTSQRSNKRFEYPAKDSFKGRPFFRGGDWPTKLKELGINQVLLLTPNNQIRQKALQICSDYKFNLVSAIHPTVQIMDQALMEPGIWVNTGAIIGYKSEVKSGVMINTRAIVEHHTILESCCQLDPAVVVAGNAKIEECAHLHMGALIANRLNIGANAIIGAGSVVLKNVTANTKVAGVPAKEI